MNDEGSTPFERINHNAERLDTVYDHWASSQGIDIVKGYFVENVNTLPLKRWERMGGQGTLINLEGTGYLDDAFVCSLLRNLHSVAKSWFTFLKDKAQPRCGRKIPPSRVLSGKKGVCSRFP